MKELKTLNIKIPISWNKQSLSFDNTSCIFLTKIVAKCHGEEILTDYVKEIVVYDNMTVRVQVAGEPIDLNNLGSLVNETPVCRGCETEFGIHGNTSVGYRESETKWRHNQCPIFIANNASQCNFCRNVLRTFDRKQVKCEQDGYRSKRLRLSDEMKLPAEIRMKIDAIRKEKKATQKCATLRSMIEKQKLQLEEKRNKILEIEEKSVEEKMESIKLSPNFRMVVREIFTAAKVHPKGRRYSEDWMLSCMLMYMKFPKVYALIDTLESLPLPCIRTIKRYVYFFYSKLILKNLTNN